MRGEEEGSFTKAIAPSLLAKGARFRAGAPQQIEGMGETKIKRQINCVEGIQPRAQLEWGQAGGGASAGLRITAATAAAAATTTTWEPVILPWP